jgi:hypothetical protein
MLAGMSLPDRESWTEAECEAEFRRLFPNGLAGEDVLAEIAPEGWAKSPLISAFHPTLDQAYEEAVAFHENLANLPWGKPKEGKEERPAPTREEIAAEFRETPIEPRHECAQLVGECVWDVFSDSHEVIGPDRRVLDLGSFRSSAGFIADFAKPDLKSMEPLDLPEEFQIKLPEGFPPFDMSYMQFYMGSTRTSARTDLTPIYRMIFRRLKARGHDWVYHFPQIHLVDMRPLKEQMDQESGKEEFESYDPSAAFGKEEEDAEHDRDLTEMREKLAEGHREAIEESRHRPPPRTVLAYQLVYGHFPSGWPPVA